MGELLDAITAVPFEVWAVIVLVALCVGIAGMVIAVELRDAPLDDGRYEEPTVPPVGRPRTDLERRRAVRDCAREWGQR